ncbi:RNA polymerase sigma-54 factor, partial [Thermodesulfobacteriota bacterium]
MAVQIRQTLRQTQQLVMTPQLQQAIKLLQYNHLEMVDALEIELKENPLLEVSAFDEPFTEQESGNRNDLNSIEDLVKEPDRSEQDVLKVDWESYLETYGSDYTPVNREAVDRNPLENMAVYQSNLFHHLLGQLQLSRIEGEDRRIALELIGNIDENGYLDVELHEVAESNKTDLDHVEAVLHEVQRFDPLGVAARDLKYTGSIEM